MRLIDADELKKITIRMRDREMNNPYLTLTGEHIMCAMNLVANIIDEQPTIDGVKHGYWGRDHKCSICKEEFYHEGTYYHSEYCPNCGAKMDAERKEE